MTPLSWKAGLFFIYWGPATFTKYIYTASKASGWNGEPSRNQSATLGSVKWNSSVRVSEMKVKIFTIQLPPFPKRGNIHRICDKRGIWHRPWISLPPDCNAEKCSDISWSVTALGTNSNYQRTVLRVLVRDNNDSIFSRNRTARCRLADITERVQLN